MGRSAWTKSEDYLSKFSMYGANLYSLEKQTRQSTLWVALHLGIPNSSQNLRRLLFLGKKNHQGLKLLCQNSGCVPHSLRLGQRTSFTGGAGNILGMYRTRLGMNSFQRASPLSFTSINNKSAWSNGVSQVQIAQESCEWHLHSPHSGATLGNTKTSAEE